MKPISLEMSIIHNIIWIYGYNYVAKYSQKNVCINISHSKVDAGEKRDMESL